MKNQNQKKSPEEQILVESWNRVLSRVKNGKDLTKDNLEKIKEMKEWGL